MANRRWVRRIPQAALAWGAVGSLWVGAAEHENDWAGAIEIVDVVAPLAVDDADARAEMQAASGEELAAGRQITLADHLARNLPSVFVNEAQGNPLQPDLRYRGFVGSPLLGLPQGLAVTMDGVRLNEPFGDTVSWALVPDAALEAAVLVPGANPLFGLNALGGALALRTKDGFAGQGLGIEASAGSFGRWALAADAGGATGERFAYFGTASTLREDGWRDYSPTKAAQAFGKLSWRGAKGDVDATLHVADTALVGNGAAPEELLAVSRRAVFTRPDETRNRLVAINLLAGRDLGEKLSLRGNLHFRGSDIDTYNGDDSDFKECERAVGLLCVDEEDEENVDGEEVVEDRLGRPVAASEALEGATINRTRTNQRSGGFGVHAERAAASSTWRNRAVFGIALEVADVDFDSSTELGTLDETRLALPGGVFVGDGFTAVDVATRHASVYVANSFAPRPSLRLDAALRYNDVAVELRDQLGTALDGSHRFRKLNPSLGATLMPIPKLAFYARYGESSRVPSPVELTCADEDDPCRLPNAFLADPPLEQVEARTVEAGARGGDGAWNWRVGWFHTRNENDILFVSAGALASEGYFDNVGTTLRRGIEASVAHEGQRLRWFVHGTLMRATFEDAFHVPSLNHPQAVDGAIPVQPGDSLPLVPERLLKAGVAFAATERLGVDVSAHYASSHHLRGDEGNLVPGVGSYAVANLRIDYRFGEGLLAFAKVDNVLNERYATFGVFGEADEVLGDAFESPQRGPLASERRARGSPLARKSSRFVTPAAPRAGWLGIELRR